MLESCLHSAVAVRGVVLKPRTRGKKRPDPSVFTAATSDSTTPGTGVMSVRRRAGDEGCVLGLRPSFADAGPGARARAQAERRREPAQAVGSLRAEPHPAREGPIPRQPGRGQASVRKERDMASVGLPVGNDDGTHTPTSAEATM